ncbi:MAG: hypothetical protein ACI4RA_08780 [Kiritimatiellia bacterium]
MSGNRELRGVGARPWRVIGVLLSAVALTAGAARAEGPDFRFRPPLAGRASLAEPGFVLRRGLGVAAFAPELCLPLELVYESSSGASGAFGHAWRCPQLESSVKWEKDGLLWTTPWGERLKFFPRKSKASKVAALFAPADAAKRGRGLFAPYSDWEADCGSGDPGKAREFTLSGRNALRGWSFVYSDARLRRVATPHGAEVNFEYAPSGELAAVASRGTRFIELDHADGLVSALRVNGVPVALRYADVQTTVLPKTLDGLPAKRTARALASVRTADLDPETFAYAKGYLASASRGGRAEKFAVQTETPDERRRNILSEDRRSGVAHTGKVAGRLLSDSEFRYSYPSKTAVELVDALGATARHDYDAKTGTYRIRDFAGRTTTTYYFMRHDAAYLGRVRKVVDGRGRDLADFRYDKATGRPVRVADRLGNKRLLEYDARGNCVRLSRRADWSLAEEPVRAFAYDRQDRLAAVSELDADGKAVRTTRFAYDGSGRPSKVSDGRRALSVSCTPSGFPALLEDGFSSVSFAYDRYNRLVSSTDPYGVATVRTYAAHGGIAKIERRDGAAVLSSLSVAYDGRGLPVSATDQDGRTTACDRDALGRIVKERCADGAEVAYAYDGIGRLAKVVDENGHEIKFGWDRFGLSSRLTAAGQLTEAKRGADGLVQSVSSSATGRVGRVVRREHDAFDRVAKIDYGNGETETFAYDKWGRLAARTRGKAKETYAYDHFGRLVEKEGNGVVTAYTYDAWGRRTSRAVRTAGGETTVETRRYDRYGRLAEIASFGSSVKYFYDMKGRVARQVVDGTPIDFAYTKRGRLAGKYLGGREKPEASVEYEYSRSGRIAARTANGVRQTYEYDARGQLLAVKEDGADVERYAYDRAGNMVERTVRGRTTTFAFDGANQLVSSTTDGVTTKYAYDAAGRLVKEGGRTYRYGYLDKVLSTTEGGKTFTYAYHVDGQLARADYGDGRSEDFAWDGLALVGRGDARFVNEPHVGGGNPVVSSAGATYLNDLLGTTVGFRKGRAYSAAALTAFGEPIDGSSAASSDFFTGKPQVAGLGRVFLFRNYRADLAKWQTADPLGYPDGWNQLAYCGNGVTGVVDFMGAYLKTVREWDTSEGFDYVYKYSHTEYRTDYFCFCDVYECRLWGEHHLEVVECERKRKWEIEGITDFIIVSGITLEVVGNVITYRSGQLPTGALISLGGMVFSTVGQLLDWLNSEEEVEVGNHQIIDCGKKIVDSFELHIERRVE